jgi:hypothetical protein
VHISEIPKKKIKPSENLYNAYNLPQSVLQHIPNPSNFYGHSSLNRVGELADFYNQMNQQKIALNHYIRIMTNPFSLASPIAPIHTQIQNLIALQTFSFPVYTFDC